MNLYPSEFLNNRLQINNLFIETHFTKERF